MTKRQNNRNRGSSPPERDYEVGYGRPPKATQFQPGQSGNPKGRTKGVPNHATEIRLVLNGPVSIVRNGKRKTVTAFVALLLQLTQKGLSGDVKAIQTLLALAERYGLGLEDIEIGEALTDDDRRVLKEHLADLRDRNQGPSQ